MAVAELKAFLGIDTKDYEAGMQKVTGDTRRFQTEIGRATQQLQSSGKVAQGFSQILSGNVAQGIASLISGMTKLGDKASLVVTQIGSVFAAAAAGYRIGQQLDKALGISDWVGRQFKEKGGEPEWFKELRQRRADRLFEQGGQERAATFREETEREEAKDPTISRSEKLRRNAAAEIADMKKEQAQVVTDIEWKAYQERIIQTEQFLAMELALIEKSEAEKAAKERQSVADRKARDEKAAQDLAAKAVADEKKVTDAIAKERAGADKRIADIKARPMDVRGQGIRVDSSAALGGFVGRSRTGLEAKSKELAVISETLKRQIEIRDIAKESLKTQQEIRDRSQPNGGPQG
jgi:hypothetical protein